jgi:hypothetical protein
LISTFVNPICSATLAFLLPPLGNEVSWAFAVTAVITAKRESILFILNSFSYKLCKEHIAKNKKG